METLVLVARHQNDNIGRQKLKNSDRFGSYSYGNLKGVRCRFFQSGLGVPPFATLGFPSSFLTQSTQSIFFRKEPPKLGRRIQPSAVSPKPPPTKASTVFNAQSCSERWAGPTYSNSPPPSSLPIPKFSFRQKRSLSLELPVGNLGIILLPETKSAPASPTGDFPVLSRDSFLDNASATQNLRRMLNLDPAD